jgi:hypothetical protein
MPEKDRALDPCFLVPITGAMALRHLKTRASETPMLNLSKGKNSEE